MDPVCIVSVVGDTLSAYDDGLEQIGFGADYFAAAGG